MWKRLYDGPLESFTVRWSSFINASDDTAFAEELRRIFTTDVYSYAGYTLLLVTGICCYLYYYVLAKKPGYYFKLRYWLLFMGISAMIVLAATYFLSASELKKFSSLRPPSFAWNLAVINTLYSLVLFWIISVFIKWGSPAKTTPRFYPY